MSNVAGQKWCCLEIITNITDVALHPALIGRVHSPC
jgi:hypothetical protein